MNETTSDVPGSSVTEISLNQLRGLAYCEPDSPAARLAAAAANSRRITVSRVSSAGARQVKVWAGGLTLIAHPATGDADAPSPTTSVAAPLTVPLFLDLCSMVADSAGTVQEMTITSSADDLVERARVGDGIDELLIVALPDATPISWTAVAVSGSTLRWGWSDGDEVSLDRSSTIGLTAQLLELMG